MALFLPSDWSKITISGVEGKDLVIVSNNVLTEMDIENTSHAY